VLATADKKHNQVVDMYSKYSGIDFEFHDWIVDQDETVEASNRKRWKEDCFAPVKMSTR